MPKLGFSDGLWGGTHLDDTDITAQFDFPG